MRILGVDLSALFRRNWEANQGREDSAAFDRTVQAVTSLRDGFDRVAICCDGGPSFRRVFEPAYKSNRTRPPAAYYEQQQRTVERLRADGCSIFASIEVSMIEAGGPASGLWTEGDDGLASLAEWSAKNGHSCTIVGGDKDLLQLVDDARGVSVLRPDESEPYDEEKVSGKLGLPPSKVVDWLALAGDGADNFKPFPGWDERPSDSGRPTRKPGIGDKTAVELIKKWGCATAVADAALRDNAEGTGPEIGGHVGEVLRRAGPVEAAFRGLRLATLRRDLPLDFERLLAEPVKAAIVEDRHGPPPATTPIAEVASPPALQVVERAPQEPSEPGAASAQRASSTALARVESTVGGLDRLAFQPRDLDSLWWTAKALYTSRLFPLYGNPEAIMAVAIEAGERGIPIGLALRNAYVVKGRPAWSAQLLAALVLSSGLATVFEITESTSERATLTYQRKGRPEREFAVTIEEARSAGWLRSGERGDSKWLTNPRTMLRWFAIREAARAFFPDVVAGMYTPEELRGDATDADLEHDEVIVLPGRAP